MAKYVKDEKGYPHLFRLEKTGVWYFREYRTGRGQTQRSLKTKNRDQAIARLKRERGNWLGTRDEKTARFDDIEAEVLEAYQSQSRRTYENYESFRRLYLLPYFTGKLISDVESHWPKYKAQQRRDNPVRKLDHDRRYLTVILKHAVKLNALPRVPEMLLDPQDTAVTEGIEWTNEDIAKLFEANDKSKYKTLKVRRALKWELQLKTGMRTSEARLLKWDYIDRASGRVRLPKGITKTRRERTYFLDLDLVERLFAIRTPSPYVFPHRLRPMEPQAEGDKTFQRIKRLAGIKPLRQHWMRHTFVTRAVRAGIPGEVVQKSVGMSDQVMKRVYLHANDADAKRLSTVVGDSLKGES